MESDRELLELAAKAMGLGRLKYLDDTPYVAYGVHGDNFFAWNPSADDGDALRLAVKLNIHITSSATDAWASTLSVTAIEPMGADPYAATRRAIVRAAAEIGKTLG